MKFPAISKRLPRWTSPARAYGWALLCLTMGSFAGKLDGALVSLELKNAPLEQALREAASQAQVHLVYADALVRGLRVDCHVREMPLREVLPRLLEGTAIGFRWVRPDRVVLFAKEGKPKDELTGIVVDAESGHPLAGARIQFTGSDQAAVSDQNGSFSLKGPQQASSLRIERQGYLPRQLLLSRDYDPANPVFPLTAIPHVSEHLEITPTGNLPLQYAARPHLMTISPNELSGVPGHDLFETLSMIPGLGTGPGEGGVGIRGSRPSENLVLLDGIMLYHLDHALGYLSALNGDAIENIRIFKGMYPARYGGRTSGVLDLSTKGANPDQREIQVGFDRDIGKVTLIQPLGKQVSLLLSARRSLSEKSVRGIYDRVFQYTFNNLPRSGIGEPGVDAPRSIRFSDSIAKLSWRPRPADSVALTLFQGTDTTSEAILLDNFRWVETLHAKNGRWGNDGGSLRWTHRWRNRSRTSARFVRSEYKSDFAFMNPIYSEEFVIRGETVDDSRPWWALTPLNVRNRLREEAFGLDHTLARWEKHEAEFGLVYSDRYAYYQRENELSLLDAADHGSQTAIFIQDHWKPTPALRVDAGIRGVADSLADSRHLEPRVGIQYELGSHLSARASWAEYRQFVLRSPDTVNYFEGVETWFLAGGEVLPGKSRQFSLGSRYQRGGWALDIEAYLKNQEGSLQRLYDPLLEDSQLSQTRDRIHGFEVVVQKQAETYSGWAGYRYQRARVVGELNSENHIRFPSDLDIPHQFNLVLNRQRPRWHTSLAWHYASGRPYSIPSLVLSPLDLDLFRIGAPRSPNEERLPPHHQLDLSLGYRFTWRKFEGRLELSLLNVYDRANLLHRYYTNEGTSLMAVDVPDFGFQPSLQIQTRF